MKMLKNFLLTLKVDKGKSEPEGCISERIILRNRMAAEIKKEEKNIKNELLKK